MIAHLGNIQNRILRVANLAPKHGEQRDLMPSLLPAFVASFKSTIPIRVSDLETLGTRQQLESTNQSEGSVQIAELLLFSSECHDLISFISTSRKGFGFVFKKILHINSTAACFIQRFRVGSAARLPNIKASPLWSMAPS